YRASDSGDAWRLRSIASSSFPGNEIKDRDQRRIFILTNLRACTVGDPKLHDATLESSVHIRDGPAADHSHRSAQQRVVGAPDESSSVSPEPKCRFGWRDPRGLDIRYQESQSLLGNRLW